MCVTASQGQPTMLMGEAAGGKEKKKIGMQWNVFISK